MTTLPQAATSKGVTRQRLLALIHQGRIPGARMDGGRWMLPDGWSVAPAPKRKRQLDKL